MDPNEIAEGYNNPYHYMHQRGRMLRLGEELKRPTAASFASQVRHVSGSDLLKARAIADLGSKHFRARQFEKAIPYYDRAIKMDPSDPDAHLNRAVSLCFLGRMGEARKSYQKARSLDPYTVRTDTVWQNAQTAMKLGLDNVNIG